MRLWLGSLLTLTVGTLGVGACSLVNAPDDPLAPTTTPATGGGGGSAGGTGGGTSTGTGGGGGGGPECGNGEQEGDEECDESGETVNCDADCTNVECGDGTRNATAGEQCDDGNTETGDACDDQCQITPFVIDPDATQNGGLYLLYTMPAVGLTELGGEPHFVVVWSQEIDGFNDIDVLARLYTAAGSAVDPNPTPLDTSPAAIAPSIASNGQGRSLVTWIDDTNAIYRRVLEPGALPTSGAEEAITGADNQAGIPNVGAAHTGEFCVVWQQDDPNVADFQAIHCFEADGSDSGVPTRNLGPSVVPVPIDSPLYGMHSITPVQAGFVVGWFDGSPAVYTGQRVTVTGAPDTTTFPISGLEGMVHAVNGLGDDQSNAFLAGYVVEGTFGQPSPERRPLFRAFAANNAPAGDDELITDNHQGQIGLRLVGRHDGPFLAVWSERDDGLNGCALRVRKFTAGLLPDGTAYNVVSAAQDHCANKPRATVNDAGDVMIVYVDQDDSVTPTVFAEIRGVVLPGILAP